MWTLSLTIRARVASAPRGVGHVNTWTWTWKWTWAWIWTLSLTIRARVASAPRGVVPGQFTLTHLRQCPWGFSEEELTRAIASKDYTQIDFWRRLDYGLDERADDAE